MKHVTGRIYVTHCLVWSNLVRSAKFLPLSVSPKLDEFNAVRWPNRHKVVSWPASFARRGLRCEDWQFTKVGHRGAR